MKKIITRPIASAAGALLLAAAITGGTRPVYAVQELASSYSIFNSRHAPLAGQHGTEFFAQEPSDLAARVYYADAFGSGIADTEGKTEAEFLKERLARYEAKRKEYAAKLDEYRKKSDKDLPNKERIVSSYERSLKSYDEYIERVRKQIPEAEKRAPLQKPVDVKFQSATVQQAAEALSKASGVPIRVDSGVPESTRLTVEAKRIRLATVLEGVAQQAGLIIEPDRSASGLGVLLTTGPSLSISVEGPGGTSRGGIERRAPRRSTPWSSEWGTPPTGRVYLYGPNDALLNLDFANLGADAALRALEGANRALSTSLSGIAIAPPAMTAIPAPPSTVIRPGTRFGAGGGSFGGSFGSNGGTISVNGKTIRVGSGASITSTSPDTVVVSEPGTNDKGEKGYFLTVYKIEKDGKLNKVSTTFHAASSNDKDDKKDGQNTSGGGAATATISTE